MSSAPASTARSALDSKPMNAFQWQAVLICMVLTSSPTLAFGHREGDSYCAMHERSLA